MPPTEDWKSVKAEIIAELQKERRKEEVSAGLEEKSKLASVANFFQHPAVLLALTFLLTSIVGTQITDAWQEKQEDLQQKYALIDQTNKAVAEYVIAAEDIVGMYQQEQAAPNRDEIERDRWKLWQQKSREWRIFEETFPEKLELNLPSEDVQKSFAQIVTSTDSLGWEIKELKSTADETQWKDVSTNVFQDRTEKVLEQILNVSEQMKNLRTLMAKEVHSEEWPWWNLRPLWWGPPRHL